MLEASEACLLRTGAPKQEVGDGRKGEKITTCPGWQREPAPAPQLAHLLTLSPLTGQLAISKDPRAAGWVPSSAHSRAVSWLQFRA